MKFDHQTPKSERNVRSQKVDQFDFDEDVWTDESLSFQHSVK